MTSKPAPSNSPRTMDLIASIILVGVVTSITGAILAQTLQQDPRKQASQTAESLARQLYLQQDRSFAPEAVKAADRRVPASAETPLMGGSLGLDPWGNPYHYLVRQVQPDGSLGADAKSSRPHLRITVWSDGPNAKSETQISELERNTHATALALAGDDVGFTQDFPAER